MLPPCTPHPVPCGCLGNSQGVDAFGACVHGDSLRGSARSGKRSAVHHAPHAPTAHAAAVQNGESSLRSPAIRNQKPSTRGITRMHVAPTPPHTSACSLDTTQDSSRVCPKSPFEHVVSCRQYIPTQWLQQHSKGLAWLLHEKGMSLKLSGSEVYYTACFLLQILKNSCCKLHLI